MRLTTHCQESAPSYKLAGTLRDDLGRGESILLLDCRGNEEYLRGHIQGAYNIVLPQLLLRRLKANKLPLRNLVPANITQDKDVFLAKILTSDVIIYDDQSSDLICKDRSLQLLLHKRMANEGCRVAILKGGFSKFRSDYPELCSGEVGSASAANGGSGLPECNDDPVLPPIRRCTPPVIGVGSLTLCDCLNQSEIDPPSEGSTIEGGGLLARRSRRNGRNFPTPLTINNDTGAEHSNQVSSLEKVKNIPSPLSSCPVKENQEDSASCRSPSSFPIYGNNTAPVEILPYLFLGCARDASSREILSQYNITYILNVTPNLPNVFEKENKYHYKQIPISDHWSQNLSQFFPEAISFIDKARSERAGVLVHCLAGISRSVTVTVAYLMQKNLWSLNDAYDFVKQLKSNVSPNFNFMGQLLDFEKTLGINQDAADSEVSSSSSNSPPTLIFTSPPPPTPSSVPVASTEVVTSPCASGSEPAHQENKTMFSVSYTMS